jgi:hypothetical protein
MQDFCSAAPGLAPSAENQQIAGLAEWLEPIAAAWELATTGALLNLGPTHALAYSLRLVLAQGAPRQNRERDLLASPPTTRLTPAQTRRRPFPPTATRRRTSGRRTEQLQPPAPVEPKLTVPVGVLAAPARTGPRSSQTGLPPQAAVRSELGDAPRDVANEVR